MSKLNVGSDGDVVGKSGGLSRVAESRVSCAGSVILVGLVLNGMKVKNENAMMV